jgi:uncharacterized protein
MERIAGMPVRMLWQKWNGAPHWEHDCIYLGSDQWGHWVGQEIGWRSERPGASMPARSRTLSLIPPSADHVPTFNARPLDYAVYVDIAWDVRWDGADVVRGIDMDLDVIRARDERGTWIDDEDEWADHRVRYGYPEHIVRELEERTSVIAADVRDGRAPYDEATVEFWNRRLDEVLAQR